MKSSHSRYRKVQKTLLHSKTLRKVSSATEARKMFLLWLRWRKVTLAAEKCRKLYCTTES